MSPLRVFSLVLLLLAVVGTADAISVKEVRIVNESIVVYFDVTPFEMVKFILFGSGELKDYLENFVQNATPYKVGYFSAYLHPESDVVRFAQPVLIYLNDSVYLLSDTIRLSQRL